MGGEEPSAGAKPDDSSAAAEKNADDVEFLQTTQSFLDEGAELSSSHLLGLLMEFRTIRNDVASRKLGVRVDEVDAWAAELEGEGWITSSAGVEAGIKEYSITKKGLDRVSSLKKKISIKEKKGDEKKKRKLVNPMGLLSAKIKPLLLWSVSLILKLKLYSLDIIIGISFLSSLYLTYRFLKDPNAESVSFFFAVIILSIIVVFYNQYKKYLQSKGLVGLVDRIIFVIDYNKKSLILLLIFLLIIYDVAQIILHPLFRGMYLMYLMIFITTSVLVYYPKKKIMDVVKFYIGMSSLMYSMLLMSGISSITLVILGGQYRTFDFFFGFCLVVVIQLNENSLGVGVKSLKKMLTEQSGQKQ